jgi:hypothetical protein
VLELAAGDGRATSGWRSSGGIPPRLQLVHAVTELVRAAKFADEFRHISHLSLCRQAILTHLARKEKPRAAKKKFKVQEFVSLNSHTVCLCGPRKKE